MPDFAGMDTDVYPGDDTLAWLKANTNLVWCGYYLAPAPSHPDTSWMGNRAAMVAAGWGLAPVYVGQELADGPGSHIVTAAQGAIDGADAAALMTSEGFAPGSYVYLDLEQGAPLVSPRTDYVIAWVAAVAAAGFSPGVYCSHAIATPVNDAVPQARIWAFKVSTTTNHPVPGTNFPNPPPSGSGYPDAYMWQRDQAAEIGVAPPGTLLVDLNTAVGPDPSAA